MTDAKGLSEEDVRDCLNDCEWYPGSVPALVAARELAASHKALAERLAEYDRWLSGGVYFTNDEFVQHVKEADAIKADLERARAEVERLKAERQTDRNLTNALADERCRCFLERAENAEQSNERLKAALAAIVRDNEAVCNIRTIEDLKALNGVYDKTMEEAQAALKETP